MTTTENILDAAALDQLLSEILNTGEKVDIAVHLHRARAARPTTRSIAAALAVSAGTVAEALCELMRQGVVTTYDDDGAGWWLDPFGEWATAIATVSELHRYDRVGLMRVVARLALKRIRARAGGTLAGAVVLRVQR